jgi:hypothetical protein
MHRRHRPSRAPASAFTAQPVLLVLLTLLNLRDFLLRERRGFRDQALEAVLVGAAAMWGVTPLFPLDHPEFVQRFDALLRADFKRPRFRNIGQKTDFFTTLSPPRAADPRPCGWSYIAASATISSNNAPAPVSGGIFCHRSAVHHNREIAVYSRSSWVLRNRRNPLMRLRPERPGFAAIPLI